jgi:hypothetical protein
MNESQKDMCSRSHRADGKHSWEFDGDDPYMRCVYCRELRDTLTGNVIGGTVVDEKPAIDYLNLWTEFGKLTTEDATIRACLLMAERGNVSIEQTLITMVKQLAEQKKAYFEQLVEVTKLSPTPGKVAPE